MHCQPGYDLSTVSNTEQFQNAHAIAFSYVIGRLSSNIDDVNVVNGTFEMFICRVLDIVFLVEVLLDPLDLGMYLKYIYSHFIITLFIAG